jgi:hypothetical protein
MINIECIAVVIDAGTEIKIIYPIFLVESAAHVHVYDIVM